MSGIYFKDSVVGSFKYGDNASNPLLIKNSVTTQLKIDLNLDLTYSILFKIDNVEVLSGILNSYSLYRRTMIEGENQWGSWERIFYKTIYLDGFGKKHSENNWNVITGSDFTINNNRHQFKVEFYDLSGVIGKLDVPNDYFLIEEVEVIASENLDFKETLWIKLKSNNNLSIIRKGNIAGLIDVINDLFIYKSNVGMGYIHLSLYPTTSNGKFSLNSGYSQLIKNSSLYLKTDASFLVNDEDLPYYIIASSKNYNSIYQVPLVGKYLSSDPYVLKTNPEIEEESYNPISYALTNEQSIDIYFSLPTEHVDYATQGLSTKVTFKNILDENVEMNLPYLNNYFYKNAYVKAYIFIPEDIYSQNAQVDKNPTMESNLGNWYFKDHIKLSSLEKKPLHYTLVDVISPPTDVHYWTFAEYKLTLHNLPKKGQVFYIWLGISLNSPNDLLKPEYRVITNIPVWQ